jgi:acyl-CoA thioester hydrolase
MNNKTQEWGKHETKVEIRFADIDMLGHLNNAKYITYLESARIKYFDEVVGEIDWKKNGFILARTVIDYKGPVLLKDRHVTIYTKCSKMGNKSFDLTYILVKTNNQQEVASGVTTLVAFNYAAQHTVQIPEEWKEKITKFED